jgi:hypothetical protein
MLMYGGERTLHHAFDQMLKRRWGAWKATSGEAGSRLAHALYFAAASRWS